MPRAPLEYTEYGLFVWSRDNRYYWAERLDGKTYRRVTAAERAADRRNAAGEHGGMIVVRPRSFIHDQRPQAVATGGRGYNVTAEPNPGNGVTARRTRGTRSNPHRNPLLAVMNPPKVRVVGVLGRPLLVRYQHAQDRKFYEHKFGKTARIVLLSDGTVRIESSEGKPMWGDF